MSLKLIIESSEKIKLFDPDSKNKLMTYVLTPLSILLVLGFFLYFSTLWHPSYQIYCENKSASSPKNCKLKSTYYFIIPWYTYLGDVQSAHFQINPSLRRNHRQNSCGEITLVTKTDSNPLSYGGGIEKNISFYSSCNNFAELEAIANSINNFLTKKDVNKLNIGSLPGNLEQYFWIIVLVIGFLSQCKRIEVSFDKNLALVSVKTTLIISWTKTYPLNYVKDVVIHQTINENQHLVLKLIFSQIDLGIISDMTISEQKHLCRSIKDFLSLK
jgi:hypothetical protein